MSDYVDILFKLPQWYKVERETEKIISKLSTIPEIAFYLKNPNEYIRRLAILRLSQLRLKDSINVLNEILEDPLENQNNKELSAWVIKLVSSKWNIDLLLNSKQINK